MTAFKFDGWLVMFLLMLAVFSLFSLYSATSGDWHLVQLKAMHWLIGFAAMLAVAQINYQRIKALSPWLYALTLVLLVLVLTIGVVGKGAQRWIDLGFFHLQPSELAKITIVMMLAWWFARAQEPNGWAIWWLALVGVLVPAALIVRQPDLGTAILVILSGFIVFFLAGLKWRWIGLGLLGLAISFPFLWQELHPYQQQRILTFFDPESDPLGSGYHIIQSMTAIGSGGFWGKGWMSGTQAQLDFLPEQHTDFIFGVIAEEQGLVGILLMLGVYLIITLRCFYITLKAAEGFGRLLAGGLSFYFFLALVLNIAMVSGLTPVVGIPLPLISYGGSSLMSFMLSFGLLMAIHYAKKETR